MDSSWERIRPLLEELLELDPSELSQALKQHTGDDEALRKKLQKLLAIDSDSQWLKPDTDRIEPPLDTVAEAAGPGVADDRIGPYRLIRELGRGGQAVVYLAEDPRIEGRRVAVKILTRNDLLSPGALERFRREAAVAAKLEHPGICPVHEAGIDGARPYIAMRYIDGETLAACIHRSAGSQTTEAASSFFDIDTDSRPDASPSASRPDTSGLTAGGPVTREAMMNTVQTVEKIARALHAAHEAGIIHRDIKPGNVMITKDGEPVLMDFGLARDVEGVTVTREGDLFGTPAYMSPEQLLAQKVRLDARTDVWSLGVTLFECLTLRRPFESPTRDGLFRAIQVEEPQDPRRFNQALPYDLVVVIETALDKDRNRRYQTAHDLAEDLRRIREYEPIAARPASAWVKLRRWGQRNPALAGSVTAGFLALAGGLAVALLLLSQRDTALSEKQGALTRYEQMADMTLVEQLHQEVEDLWPRRSARMPAMKDWLKRARKVQARRRDHEAALEALRRKAAPYDAEQQAADDLLRRERHAGLFDRRAKQERELDKTRQRITSYERQRAEVESAIEDETDDRALYRQEGRLDRIMVALEDARLSETRQVQELEELGADPRFTERLTWRLAGLTDQWRHGVLTQLIRELKNLEVEIADVDARLAFAGTIATRSVTDHAALWARCREDLRSNAKYEGSRGIVDALPLTGLVPLGIDRRSGLWEFWHVGSGERPGWKGSAWPEDPAADPRGDVAIEEASGIVLVLIPGGTFVMGASRTPGAPHYDQAAHERETPPHEVTLDPFLLGKHEVTQGQWRRVTGDVPSTNPPGDRTLTGDRVNWLHPVTNVSWHECVTVLRRWDLVLPTEARWEYATRAGTTTRAWCGDAEIDIEIARAGNVADETARPHAPWRCTAVVRDGYAIHAPIGRFAPNPFGLHDVVGNVWEWCADKRASYLDPARPGDGLRDAPGIRFRVMRGGAFSATVSQSRSSHREVHEPKGRGGGIGLRPARDLR